MPARYLRMVLSQDCARPRLDGTRSLSMHFDIPLGEMESGRRLVFYLLRDVFLAHYTSPTRLYGRTLVFTLEGWGMGFEAGGMYEVVLLG